MSRFALDTSVPVDRTRAEINRLLTDWKCASIGWTDHLAEKTVAVEFVWLREEKDAKGLVTGNYCYKVRFSIGIPKTRKKRKREWGAPPALNENEQAQAWRSAHRLLLLKLKADLNAAAAGLAKAEEIFLPWIVDENGRTLSEAIMPALKERYSRPALPAKAGLAAPRKT